MRLRTDVRPPGGINGPRYPPLELAPENVPELQAAGNQEFPSGQQPLGTTFSISCRRHGNLITWAWTPGDPRQQGDLQNLYRLLASHADQHSRWWGASICNLEFLAEPIKNV